MVSSFKDSRSERSQIGRSIWSQTCRRRCANSWRCIHIGHMISLDVLICTVDISALAIRFSVDSVLHQAHTAKTVSTAPSETEALPDPAELWHGRIQATFTYAPLTCSQQRYHRKQVVWSICTSGKKIELRQTGRIQNPNNADWTKSSYACGLSRLHETTAHPFHNKFNDPGSPGPAWVSPVNDRAFNMGFKFLTVGKIDSTWNVYYRISVCWSTKHIWTMISDTSSYWNQIKRHLQGFKPSRKEIYGMN